MSYFSHATGESTANTIDKNRERAMKKDIFLKGSALFAVARRKAPRLGIEAGRLSLAELIRIIQEKEGHTPCFRSRKTCPEASCCWQQSCGAVITDEN